MSSFCASNLQNYGGNLLLKIHETYENCPTLAAKYVRHFYQLADIEIINKFVDEGGDGGEGGELLMVHGDG
jgi:hypothetical protein